MIDNKNTIDQVLENTKKQDPNEGQIYDKLGFDHRHNQNVKKIAYDDAIRYPKRPPMIPKIIEDGDVELGGKSNFIDLDTYRKNEHNNFYQPAVKYGGGSSNNNEETRLDGDMNSFKDNFNSIPEYNKKGIKVDENDYIPLDGFYKAQDDKISKNLKNYNNDRTKDYKEIQDFNAKSWDKKLDMSHIDNVPKRGDLDKNGTNDEMDREGEFKYNDKMSINHVYNRNLERLRWLNNIEELNN